MDAKDVERIDYHTYEDKLDVYLHQKRYQLATQALQGITILDLGCGYGFGTKQMAMACPDKHFIAIDINPEVIVYAQTYNQLPNITYHNMSATDLQFENEYFDTVTSIENIEHIPDDLTYVAEAYRVLKPGGLLFLTTPNDNRLPHRIKRLLGKKIVYNRFHVREYTLSQLQGLLQKEGFSIRSVQGLYLSFLPRNLPLIRRFTQLPFIYRRLVNINLPQLTTYFALQAIKPRASMHTL